MGLILLEMAEEELQRMSLVLELQMYQKDLKRIHEAHRMTRNKRKRKRSLRKRISIVMKVFVNSNTQRKQMMTFNFKAKRQVSQSVYQWITTTCRALMKKE